MTMRNIGCGNKQYITNKYAPSEPPHGGLQACQITMPAANADQ